MKKTSLLLAVLMSLSCSTFSKDSKAFPLMDGWLYEGKDELPFYLMKQ